MLELPGYVLELPHEAVLERSFDELHIKTGITMASFNSLKQIGN